MSLPFDARALTEPVDRATARAYVARLKAAGRMPATSPVGVVLAVVAGAFFLIVFGTVFASVIGAFVALGANGVGVPLLFAIVPVVILVVFLVVAGVSIWGFATGRFTGAATRAYRLDRFAQANGMTWYPEAQDPPLPGLIFGLGHSRVATDVVRGTRPRLVEFANYRYKTGSGKEETTHSWGYVAVKLQTPLPHIVLDATGNNGLFGSNLPASFDRDQRLSLEGDFDRYFSLSCPAGYERDALYLFTPDIMARFIDTAAALDVEIVDDWLFLYLQRQVSTVDPATWAWLFSVVGALLDKLAQWERWRDDRLAAPAAPAAAALPFAAPTAALSPPVGVASEGRRLRRKTPWGFIVVAVLFTGFWIVSQFGAFAGLVGSLFGR